MRTVACLPLNRDVSVLGFGCASLGSRVSPPEGRRAVDLALELGVTWFDVAPSYGDGDAETLLGRALKGRRNQVVICTKAGLVRPPISGPKAIARSLARPVVKALPGLRALAAHVRGPAVRQPITGDAVVASLEESLRRLDSDYVDVFALHDPAMDEVLRDDVLRALETAVTSGKALTLSIAGDAGVAARALRETSIYRCAQFALNPLTSGLNMVREADADAFVIGHSVLGPLARIAAAEVRMNKSGEPGRAADLLIDWALGANPNGVILLSMARPGNIRRNVMRAGPAPESVARARIDALLGPASEQGA